MKILELFSGYGTASFALKRLQVPYELVGYSDIDKYANQCFKQNHCPNDTADKLRLGDVTQVDANSLPDFDLLTGGFPCQAFSVAGKMQGELDPRGTLFYEIVRVAEVKQPKYILLENVKGLTSKKFKDTFNTILSELNRIGYDVYWDVLNTKDYGIPQSRARVWFVCFRKDLGIKDFKFPEKQELKIFIKDILEPVVDEKYYLSEKMQERFNNYLISKTTKTRDVEEAISYAQSRADTENKPIQLDTYHLKHGEIRPISTYCPDNQDVHRCLQAGEPKEILVLPSAVSLRTYPRTGTKEVDGERHQNIEPRKDGCSNTLSSVQKDSLVAEPMISTMSPRECGWKHECPTLRARDYKDPNIVSNTVTTAFGRKGCSKEELESVERNMNSGKLRRLTPKECFRLQGFLNDEVNLDGLSDTQCYKLAGNGQSVNVVEKIFKQMFNL
jgi:DNA (cytosine-5)-methyltransferase 1